MKKKNYSSIIGTFEVKNKNNKIIKLYPEIRVYNQPIIATSEAAIKTTLFKSTAVNVSPVTVSILGHPQHFVCDGCPSNSLPHSLHLTSNTFPILIKQL